MPDQTNNNQTPNTTNPKQIWAPPITKTEQPKKPEEKLIWAPPVRKETVTQASTAPVTPPPVQQPTPTPIHLSENGEAVDKEPVVTETTTPTPRTEPTLTRKENLMSDVAATVSKNTPSAAPARTGVSGGNLDTLRARVTELSIGSDKKEERTPPAVTQSPETTQTPPKPIQPAPVSEDGVVFTEPKQEKKEILNESPEEAQQRAQEEVKQELDVQKDTQARQQTGPPKAVGGVVKPLRTYKDDLAQALQSKGTSYVGIVAAEERRRGGRADTKKEKKPFKIPMMLIGIVSGILLLAGVAVLVYTFFVANSEVTVIPPEEVPSFIFTERQRELDITGLNDRELMRFLTDTTQAVSGGLGSIEQLYFTHEVPLLGSGEIDTKLVSARAFLEQLDLRTPDTLLRTLNNEMTFGVHIFNGNQPFMILKTSFYENAFSGMLEWEQYMNEDLAPLFGPVVKREVSTSTPFVNIPFKDRILRNKEVRILEAPVGSPVLLYAFFDRNTIIITTNEYTFSEIISRLTAIRI